MYIKDGRDRERYYFNVVQNGDSDMPARVKNKMNTPPHRVLHFLWGNLALHYATPSLPTRRGTGVRFIVLRPE